jgi:3-hydroxyacyl-[acyl-carrier-protein] dehydratase
MSPGHPLEPILAATPHRHPMLLIDRLEALVPGRSGSALKAVSANEMHFAAAGAAAAGMPPTLLVDALGQLAIVVLAPAASEGVPAAPPPVYYLADIEGMEFDRPPRPGDVLRMEATVGRTWGRTSRVQVRGEVDGRRVAAGTMILARSGSEGDKRHV